MRTLVYMLIFAGRVEKTYPLPRGEGGPAKPGRETAPSGACGEQPPKAALSERRNSGGNLRFEVT